MTFKVRLLLGAAAPFVLAAPAHAQVTITTATTTPIQTSTANNGAASDVTVGTGGSVNLTNAASGTAAVTINSNNNLTNSGTISTVNSNNTVGVRILPGLSGSYTGTGGSISLLEDYTRTDTDNDGDPDGPLAIGTGRFGLLLEPGGTLTGNISIRAGNMVVEGNNSAGVSLRSALVGNYDQAGSISITGSNSIGVDIQKDVTGNVRIGGSTVATGEGSSAARILGSISGEFRVDGVLLATGFTDTTKSNYQKPNTLDPDDLLVGGSALEVRGNLSRGLLLNGPAVGGVDPTPSIKDVVQNFNENRSTASVSTFGSAPAILVQSLNGAAGSNIVLQKVRESVPDTLDDDKDGNITEIIGVFDYDYGFINRGSLFANGLNTGFSATGIRIAGSADGLYTTTVAGGVFNGGQVQAQSFEADSVGLQIGSGALTPSLVNIGGISSTATTATTNSAWGVRIDSGANVSSVSNGGLMQGSVRGYNGKVFAFQDLSGTVTSFTNSSRLSAGYIDNDVSDNITSGPYRPVAVDLSRSLSNVVFTQNDTVDNARTFGDVLLGVGNDQVNLLSGEMEGNISFGVGSDTLNINSAKLFGDVTFGGSGASVTLTGGGMAGNISLGAGTGALNFLAGSSFAGNISRTGAGPMTLNVNDSTFNNGGTGTLNLNSLTFANNAKIGLVIDNARIAANTPLYTVSGTATIGANTVFTPIFSQFSSTPFTLRLLNAGVLNLGGPLSAMLNAQGPYLFNMSLAQPTGVQGIDLSFRVKSTSELGLNQRQSGAYGAVLDLMKQQDSIGAAISAVPARAEFLRGWSDLLPGSDAAIMRVLASNATAAFGATAHRLDLVSRKPDAPGGAWVEEFGVHHTSDASSRSAQISGGGLGVAAGIDVLSTGSALVGAYASLESAELEEETRTGAPLNVSQTSIGAYGGWQNGSLAINGAASYGFIDFVSDRKIAIASLTDRVKGQWKGQSYTAAARATYTMPVGWLDVRPFVAADLIGFNQDGYTETAATNSKLAITAGKSDASLATASYGVALVGNLGSDDAFSFKPEISVGYRNVLSWNSSPASMRFGGNSAATRFTLDPGVEPEDAIVAGLGLNVDSQFLNIKIGYDAEISDTSVTHYGSVTLRMAFW